MTKPQFIELLQKRTQKLVVDIIFICRQLPRNTESFIFQKQIIRSASSVASNYRAACRSRSQKEFFSKMSIVVEEADETCFWLELLVSTQLLTQEQIATIYKEAIEILSVMSKARSNIY